MNVSFYEILNVEKTASAEDIKAAYRKALRQTHPDTGGNAALFGLVQEAYETLGDVKKRTNYDYFLKTGNTPYAPPSSPTPPKNNTSNTPPNKPTQPKPNTSYSPAPDNPKARAAKEAQIKAAKERAAARQANLIKLQKKVEGGPRYDAIWVTGWLIIGFIINITIINSGPDPYSSNQDFSTLAGYHFFYYAAADAVLLIPAYINRAIVYKYREIKLRNYIKSIDNLK